MPKYEKELKLSDDMVVGDRFKVGGLLCETLKIESIFYRTPDAALRFEMAIIGAPTKKRDVVVFLPHNTPIVTLK